MYMDSRVWNALPQGAKEQYKQWFGNIETRQQESPRPLKQRTPSPTTLHEKR